MMADKVSEKSSKLYGSVKEFLAEGNEDHINRMYLNNAEVAEGKVVGLNDGFNRRFRKKFAGKLDDVYGKGNVEYSVLKQDCLPMEVAPVSYAEKRGDDLFRRCLGSSYIEKCFEKDPNFIIHGGNRGIYNHFGNILRSLGNTERNGSCSIIHGENRFGKTSAVDDLAYMLRLQKIPTIAFGLDKLSEDLNPNKTSYNIKGGEVPEYYALAKDVAKVVIIDQAHGLLGGTGKRKWNRGGVQNWVFDLVQDVRKRGGHVLFSFTETRASKLEDIVGRLKDDKTEDKFDKSGHRDLGTRLENYVNYEIGNVPIEEREDFIGKMVYENDTLKESGVSKDEIVMGMIAAGYGTQFTPGKISGYIDKIESDLELGKDVDAASIVRRVGGKKARARLNDGRFDFNRDVEPLTKEDFSNLLINTGRPRKKIISALEDHDNGSLNLGDPALDNEIKAIIKQVRLYDSTGSFDSSDYRISKNSEKAMAKLMFKWETEGGSLF